MASTYPATIDEFPDGLPLAETAMNDSRAAHADQHQLIADAITALQTVLGTNPGGSYATVVARLNAASYTGHTHTIANVTGLQSALNGKSGNGHGHIVSDVSGLQDALDAKANASHTHSITDVSGLQTALNAKAGLSTATPSPLGTAARGTSSLAAREDHVHAMPSLTTLGAAARSLQVTAGAGLTGGGQLTANMTLAANLPASGGSNGTAATLARSDHNHDGTYARVVTQTLGSTLPAASSYPAGTIVAQY